MDIQSGKRKQIRLELDKEIFKTFDLIGDEFIGSKIVDICHHGIGIMFEDGVCGLSADQEINFSIKFDATQVDIRGIVKHSGSKFAGIEINKITKNKTKFYEYIDSRIIKKFNIAPAQTIRGLLITKLDVKTTIILLILEALLIFAGIKLYNTYTQKEDSFKYMQGKNDIKGAYSQITC